jgi:hypothetical protein
MGKDIHSTSLNQFLAQVTRAPAMRWQGQRVPREGMGFCEVAGCGAEHEADWCCGRHFWMLLSRMID